MADAAKRRAFLTADWRHLVMLNYEVAPGVLAPLVPRGTTLDLWNGMALASVVGFRFLRTKVLGVPVPFHRDFDEVNLRFYVQHTTPQGEVRHGVTFVRELVPRAAIAWLAKLVYNEPYLSAPMRSSVPDDAGKSGARCAYMWRLHSRSQHVAATLASTAALPARGSEALFVTEHYWGYTRQRDGGTVEYEVQHPPWRVSDATSGTFNANVAELYGVAFVAALEMDPRSAFIAEGSPVTVFRPRRLPG